MAKYSGVVGYVSQVETSPGVWTSVEKAIPMRGDLVRQNIINQDSAKINSDVSLGHRLSLVADSYAFENFYNIKWASIHGQKWEVTSIEIQRPRIILSLGGIWNG